MGRCRFVQPDVVRLSLSDGEWIDVKRELNAGEQRRVFSRLVKAMHFNEKTEVNPDQVGLSKIVEYVVAWSLKDDAGKSVPFSEAALANVDSATYQEIDAAVDVHDAGADQARTARKNDRDGATPSPAISPSPSSVTGASSGSVN